MPNGVAHTGAMGADSGATAAELANQALENSRLAAGGQAGGPPAGPNVMESDRGDSYVSDMSGQPGSSLIMPGGNAKESFSQQREQPEPTEPVETVRQDTNAQQRDQQQPQPAVAARPVVQPGDNLTMGNQPSVVAAQTGVERPVQEPDGRMLMRPQQQATSQPFSLSDLNDTLSEEERNQNLADLNIEAPPVVEESSPVPISANEFKKHARAQRSRTVSIQETGEMVGAAVRGKGASSKSDTGDNVAEPYEPVQNRNRLATKDASGSVFYESERETKAATTAAVARKNWTGNGFTEKVTASRDVNPEDVSIGSQIIAELIREPGNNLIQIVNDATGFNFTLEQLLDQGGMNSFIDAINQATIYVIGSKSPVPNPSSSQKRRLRVHYGRGVRVHPTQTKIYNLDFDGDGVTIQFDTDGSLFRNAMDYLINEMGEPMIDLDFFPIAQVAETRSDFIRKFRMSFLSRLGDDIDTDKLAGALYDLMYPVLAPSKKDKRGLTLDFINAMDEVASNYSNRHTVLSYILKDIFETCLLAKQLQVEVMASTNPDIMSDLVAEMPADSVVTMVIEDISMGNLPPNFQDFLIGLGRYIGEVPEKNVMFRLGADVAKRIKFSGTTFKGEEGARELYELTLEAGMAAFMSGRSNIGDKINYIQQIAKREIIRKVGFPNSVDGNKQRIYANLGQWLSAFVREYNKFYNMIDLANVEFGCDLDPIYSSLDDDHAIHGDKITDLATPIATIYGDYTLERMFPGALSYATNLNINTVDNRKIPVHRKGNTLLPRYRRTTLSKLSKDNRISVDFEELKKVAALEATEMDLVLAIADKRKSKASQFNKELDELLENFTNGLQDFADHHRKRARNVADFMAYTNDVMSCFHISGPDMFAYYGMNNPSAFLNSHYGNLMQKAANKKKNAADYMGGVRMTMVIQYRMRNVQNINAEIDRLIREEPDNLLYTIPRINELQNQLANELAVLGSSSDLWGVLAQEVNGNTSAWDTLIDTKGKSLGEWKGKDGKTHSWSDANNFNFWRKGHKRYKSLMDVMIDPSIPKSEKEAIAADVIKQSTGFLQLQRHEVNYQLEIGPHSNYTSLSTMAYRDQPNVLSDIEKANDRFKTFFKNDWEAMQKDVQQARANSQPGDLDSYIQYMAENPQAYLDVTDDLIVDAINAQMDKTSRASEKAHQEMPVDALYNALSEQRGGLTNSMYRSDARVLGMIPERNLSAFDIIAVLADPELSFTVYNGTRRYILSREVLCGDNSEEAMWDMIEKNPRIASILRPGIATVAKGNVYRNAKQGFQEGFAAPRTSKDILQGKVKAQLVDRPMFLAMVAMFRPSSGRSSRSVRQETKDSLNTLQRLIIGLGKRVADGDPINAGHILNVMGVTVESLQKVGGMDQTAAENWYNDMAECFNRYLSEVAGIIREGGFQSDARAIFDEESNIRLSFDASSVALAVDVRQTMTGAKTETSTNIEGGMTQDNLGLGLWAMSIHDEFTVIDGNMSDEELAPFVGCMTNAGLFDGTNIEDLELSLPNDVPLVVQMPEDMVRQDKTLDKDGDQIPSVARFAITKRTRGAEDHNLKAKKAGDDGLDSITKSIRHIKGANQNIGIVEEVYNSSGRFAAIIKLAQIMQSVDISEGYKDMDLADYANIASLMIKEVTDDVTGETTIVIRSLGEISLAIRNNMDQAVVEHGTPREKIANASAIAENVGIESMIKSEYLTNAALLSVSSIRSNVGVGSFNPAKNAAMSSPDRSFNLLRRLTDPELVKLPWGGTTQKHVTTIKSRTKLRSFQASVQKHIPFDTRGTNYNFIGVIGKTTETHISPGQLSVWYLSPDATQDDIDMALRNCYACGMTLAFPDISCLGDKAEFFEKDITPAPFGDGIIMLPFFDMRLNRSAISGPMAPPSFQYDPSWLWCSVEDSLNLYGLGDADALISGDAVNKTQCAAGDVLHIKFDDLFYNTREAYPDMVGPVQLCSKKEILDNIVNWQDDGPTIDFGITDENPNYDRMTRKLGVQLDEYRRSFSTADEYGFLSEAKPDRIIGWVKCYVGDYQKPVYAPIIPWPTGSDLKAPTRFSIGKNYTLDPGTDAIRIPWRITEDLEGQYCKVHDGMGAAGKTMVAMSRETDLGKLRHGRSVDMVTAAESFASRRLAWGKRMCTLKTLALTMATPPYGYNYAEHDAAFPDNPAFKQRLATERIPIEEWPSLFGTIGRFSTDPEIDALLRQQVSLAIQTGTVNPSDILATKFNGKYTFMYVDYDFMFDTSLGFQNALMNWYNSMQPDVCPPSIDSYYGRDDGKGYLFKPVVEGKSEYERGCLQMAVPHKSAATGKIFYHWENVYMSFSFFNDDYSGLHKVGLNGANRTMEQLNAMAISGKPLEGRNMQLYTENTAAPSFRTFGPNDIELDYGRFLSKER